MNMINDENATMKIRKPESIAPGIKAAQ